MTPRQALHRFMQRLRGHPEHPSRWDVLFREGVVSAGVGTYGVEEIFIHEYRTRDGSWLGARLRIGAYCSIAATEVFLHGNHHTEWVSQFPFRMIWDLEGQNCDGLNKGGITIGNDVWVGFGSTILSGVTIGDGAVIGARAVVSRDVRPYAVVVGNPAREVRRRFDDETVEWLLTLRWWDWPEEKIRASIPMLLSPPSRGF